KEVRLRSYLQLKEGVPRRCLLRDELLGSFDYDLQHHMDAVALPRRVAIAATGIAALMSGWLVLLHLRMIISPAPQEMREGGIIWITSLLLAGRNPYAVSELPASTNAYGILYHLVVLPFARLFG